MNHDNRISLTPDERNTLWHVLEFAMRCVRHERKRGAAGSPTLTTDLALDLTIAKVGALQTKIFGKEKADE